MQRCPIRIEGNKLPTPNPNGLQCFKCQGWGHRASDYPTRRNVILREGKLYYLGDEVELEAESDEIGPRDR